MHADMSDEDAAGLRRERHLDLVGRRHEPWVRRVVVVALLAIVVLALAGRFGQPPVESRAQAPRATLTVKVPHTLRAGLLYQGRIDIVAQDRIGRPTIALGPGWTEQMQINTIEPSPSTETSSAGRLQLEYDPLHTGDHLTVWLQLEANPTGAAGRRPQTVTLLDGDRPLTATSPTLTVFP